MKRAGRPRKDGTRKPSGRLVQRPDYGHPMLLAHRAAAAIPVNGASIAELASHPVAQDKRTSYPLGILHIKHDITGSQHYAGRRYAGLFWVAVRPITIPSMLASMDRGNVVMSLVSANVISEEAKTAHENFLAARAALLKTGRRARSAVETVAVYEQELASWLMAALRDGLDALYEHFERAR